MARRQWPLTFTVPFARGELADGTSVAVTNERGVRAPTQARALAHWPDGSVRWLLVDSRVDLEANGRVEMHVRPEAPPSAAQPLRVDDGQERVLIDTGAIRFEIPKKHFGILDGVKLESGPAVTRGAVTSSVTVAGSTVQALTPSSVTVLEKGPLRARIELRGTYGKGFDYLIRVDAYAGQPFVRVLHTFIDRNSAAYVEVSRLSIDVPLETLAAATWAGGVEKGQLRTAALDDAVLFYQPDNLTYRMGDREEQGHLEGWLEARTKKITTGVAARWFWEEYPKSIELRPQQLVYNLWAPQARPAKVGMGAAKTHEFVLWAAPAKTMERKALQGLAEPLVASVDPSWIVRTGALPQAITAAAPAAPFARRVVEAAERYRRRNDREPWDDRGEVRCEGIGGDRPRTGAYGMWNWGDWNYPKYQDTTKGCDAWGNLEYDTAQVLALAFAASGKPDLHGAMVAAARHFMDVDTIHFYPYRPSWVGMNHPKNPLHFTFELGGVDLGHTWTEGLISYFFLTGDERGLEAARGIADYLVGRAHGFVRGNPRQWGWPQIALIAVYDATGDAKYLEAAKQYAAGGMKAHSPTDVNKWKLGILADGLAYTDSVTRDAAIEAWLAKYVDAVTSRKVTLDARLFPAVAYMAALRGNAEWKAAALKRAEKLDLGSWGKPFTINGRLGFRIYSLLSGETPAPRSSHRPARSEHKKGKNRATAPRRS